ncbi:MAG: hypothetical protein B7Z15_06380 [Rhizobiales bacterium 32-66-8]|nr:MAG: hypothetical protein B7Z15_06380 [Rhizobiales bacterium 32-66-8]
MIPRAPAGPKAADAAEFDATARKRVPMFRDNLAKCEPQVDISVRAAQPEVRIAAERRLAGLARNPFITKGYIVPSILLCLSLASSRTAGLYASKVKGRPHETPSGCGVPAALDLRRICR